jgi:glycosyltransferase involved in cell wall biosynthesis
MGKEHLSGSPEASEQKKLNNLHLDKGRLKKTIKRLRSSGLFDSDWYLAQNPELASTEVDPLTHYVQRGAFEGQDPNPFFDSDWYLAQYADVAEAQINPLLHFIQRGAFEGRDPNPFFDSDWYLAQYADVAEAQINPLLHYIQRGVVEGRSPSSQEDSQFVQKVKLYNASLKGAHQSNLADGRITLGRVNNIKTISNTLLTKLPGYGKLRTIQQKAGQIYRREGALGIVRRLVSSAQKVVKTNVLIATSTEYLEHPQIVRLSEGQYAIAPFSKQYTYIPAAPPDDLEAKISRLAQQPFFSIVVPVYNTPVDVLLKMVDSVRQQWYKNWELILVDDASSSEETREVLLGLKHPQFKIKFLETNLGISGATNEAISEAEGEFLVLLDHDDELTHDCLYELCLCINQGNPDFIYSDEDKINPEGEFQEPHFKPKWSPDTLMSTMYTCHVCCIRKSLVEKVGGFRSEYNGCQDWDLVLRVTELTDKISHIPKVLYHWRIIPGSIATDIAAKSYVLEASKRVRQDALKRRGIRGIVEPLPQAEGYFRIAYELINNPLISIIIPSRDNPQILRNCIQSILNKTAYPNFEIVIVDNGSIQPRTHDYFQSLKDIPQIKILRHDIPFNYSELNNVGVNFANGELLLFLNDDTEVLQADWLERLGGFAQQKHIGAVGAKLIYPDQKSIQHAGILNLMEGPGHAFLAEHKDICGYYMRNLLEYNWLAVTGACLMLERVKFEQVGGFAESLPIAYNDIDLCMRLHDAGFFNVVCQSVNLVHYESFSRGNDSADEQKRKRLQSERKRLYARNPHYLGYDPFYSPNLHPDGINFDLFV